MLFLQPSTFKRRNNKVEASSQVPTPATITHDEGQDDDRKQQHEVEDARDPPLLVKHLAALSPRTNEESERRGGERGAWCGVMQMLARFLIRLVTTKTKTCVQIQL